MPIDLSIAPHILIVDDDKAIRNLLVDFLKQQGFNPKSAANATEARLFLTTHTFDVIILDVMMPGETGIEFMQDIRRTDQTPILLLTARDQLSQKIEGLDEGADDYVTKPFEPLELVARLKTLMRRKIENMPIKMDVMKIGDFQFTMNTGVLTYMGRSIPLTSTERLLLQVLLQRVNEPFSREYLAQKIGHRVSERTVDVQINRLRHKLKSIDPHLDLIQTVRHQGYAFVVDGALANE